MSRRLTDLLGPLEPAAPLPDLEVTAVTADSRRVVPGALFVAIKGTAADGHDYIPQALASGAAAIVYESAGAAALIPESVPALLVPSARRAAAVLSDHFWGHPSGSLELVAVTGTNGKTTSVHLLESIFQAAGRRTGMIGTLGRRVEGETVTASRTTPDAIELQELLAKMRDGGVTHVSMELSSHALDLDRAWGCSFAAGLFTNLSPDHLDWHADLEEYRRAKERLFTEYADLSRPEHEMIGAINVDDPAGQAIAAAARCRVVSYGLSATAQVRATEIVRRATGSTFTLVTSAFARPISLQLVGQFNIMNALGCAATAFGMGIAEEAIVTGLEALSGVPGRLEKVDRGQPFAVLVDYAHTPDALENVLKTARELEPRRLICVFGCGGNRDKTKRPVMGQVSVSLADLTVITSDNPRDEQPEEIIEQIRAGVAPPPWEGLSSPDGTVAAGKSLPHKQGEVLVEPDREAAIRLALAQAGPGDIVLICGKGHEDYQEFEGGRRVHFDDREVAAAALDERP